MGASVPAAPAAVVALAGGAVVAGAAAPGWSAGGVVAGGQHHRQGQGQAELEQPAPGQARGVNGWIDLHGASRLAGAS